jgi:ribonuclease BN (tRNA processing enzyme)
MRADVDRRVFLTAAAVLAGAAWLPRRGEAQRGKTRLILLGTGGGPRPKKVNMSSAQVMIVNDLLYVVDCGDGDADYGNLLLLSWASGLRTRVDTWGPPPIAKITRLFFEMNAYDINLRIADEGRVPLVPLIHVHELTQPGVVMRDEGVKVTCALVDHPPVTPAFAYRFDTDDRSIVISGDTNRSDSLVKLAQGADVLVHEALYVPAVDRLVARIPNAATLKKHIIDSHTSVEDCGRVAAAAGVKTLVLSHLVPPDDPAITEQMWIDAARPHFNGEIIVAHDLMEI